jgi:hypothetical protein
MNDEQFIKEIQQEIEAKIPKASRIVESSTEKLKVQIRKDSIAISILGSSQQRSHRIS